MGVTRRVTRCRVWDVSGSPMARGGEARGLVNYQGATSLLTIKGGIAKAMNPVTPSIEGCPNVVISASGLPNTDDLAAAIVDGSYYTLWEPDFDERRAILDGAKVEIWFWRTQPGFNPMSVSVEGVRGGPREGVAGAEA